MRAALADAVAAAGLGAVAHVVVVTRLERARVVVDAGVLAGAARLTSADHRVRATGRGRARIGGARIVIVAVQVLAGRGAHAGLTRVVAIAQIGVVAGGAVRDVVLLALTVRRVAHAGAVGRIGAAGLGRTDALVVGRAHVVFGAKVALV